MMILPVISTVILTADVEPWFIVTYSADLITTVFGEGNGGFGPGGPMGSSDFEPGFGIGIVVMLTYTIVGLTVSIAIANRKSVE